MGKGKKRMRARGGARLPPGEGPGAQDQTAPIVPQGVAPAHAEPGSSIPDPSSSFRVIVVPVPNQLPRWVALPSEKDTHLARVEDVIAANVSAMFPGSRWRPRPPSALPATPTSSCRTTNRSRTCCGRWRRWSCRGGGASPCG